MQTGRSLAMSRYPVTAWPVPDTSESAFQMCTGQSLALSRHPVAAFRVPDTLGLAFQLRTGQSPTTPAVSWLPAASCVVLEFAESVAQTWAVSVWPHPGIQIGLSIPDHACPPLHRWLP